MPISTDSTKVKTSYQQIISISLPIAISILIPQINFFTNTYFLGHVGESELAANAVGGIFYLVLAMICYGFNNGMQIILARRAGEENKKAMGNVFSNTLSLGLLCTLFFVAFSWFFAPYLFTHQLQNEEVKNLAILFIKIRMWGLPIYFLEQASNQFFIASKKSKNIIIGTATSTLVNIILDYVLINGHWGFAPMGIKGAAIASIAAEISFVLVAYFIIFKNKYHQIFGIVFFKKLDKKLSIDTLKVSLPLVFQYFFSISSWMLFFFYVEHLGKSNLAISQILRSVFGLIGAVSWALANTCNSMVSNLLGQKKPAEIIPLIKKILTISFPTAVCFGFILLLFPHTFLGFYTNNVLLIQQAYIPLIVVVCSTVLLSISTVVFNAVLGTGNTTINLAIEFIAIFLYIIYIYQVIEIRKMPLAYAWGSEYVYWLSILAMSIAYLRWGKWKDKAI